MIAMRQNSTKNLTRRSVLAGAGALAAATTLPVCAPAQTMPRKHRVPFGAALEYQHFLEDSDYTALFVEHCDMIFPMNALKWEALQYNRGEFDYLQAEGIIGFAEHLDRSTYGHTFVWYTALPEWVQSITSARQAKKVLINHIHKVAGHFANTVPAWDVVNEVIAHDPRDKGEWRDSVWMRTLGLSHIDIAFAAAAEAAPNAELAINDYDLGSVGPRCEARREAMLTLVRRLQDRGQRIDSIGMQGHLDPDFPIDQEGLARFIRDLQSLGVGYRITELDVNDWKLPSDRYVRDEFSADMVDQFLDAAFSTALPLSLSTWGLSDRYTWLSEVMPHRKGAKNRPLPFDENLQPKPMFDVIQRYLAV